MEVSRCDVMCADVGVAMETGQLCLLSESRPFSVLTHRERSDSSRAQEGEWGPRLQSAFNDKQLSEPLLDFNCPPCQFPPQLPGETAAWILGRYVSDYPHGFLVSFSTFPLTNLSPFQSPAASSTDNLGC